MGIDKIDVDDICNECSQQKIQECCNKCGEGICLNETCCETFPHYNKKTYTICNGCFNTIYSKFKRTTSVDQSELRLLKQKINKRMAKNMERLE